MNNVTGIFGGYVTGWVCSNESTVCDINSTVDLDVRNVSVGYSYRSYYNYSLTYSGYYYYNYTYSINSTYLG